jgi:hypothetical protein
VLENGYFWGWLVLLLLLFSELWCFKFLRRE